MLDAAVIYVPDNVEVTQPLQVLFVSTDTPGQPSASYPRLLVRLGVGSRLTLKQSYSSVEAVNTAGLVIPTTTTASATTDGVTSPPVTPLGLVSTEEASTLLIGLASPTNPDKVDEGGFAVDPEDQPVLAGPTPVVAPASTTASLVVANTRVEMGKDSQFVHTYTQESGGG